MAAPLIEKSRHHVAVDVPNDGLVVYVDRTRLAQVVSNLLTNAAKYTPSGGRIAVVAARDGDRVVVRVEDSGAGIAPELLPKVFDTFVQGSQTIERAHGGLGLGLAIAKNLVEMHGGSVRAESAGPGRGSTFTVSLPHGPDRVRAFEPASHSRSEGHGQRVLVVDDNRDAADMLAAAVAARGHITAVAHDGPEALRVARDFRPDAALLDIGLPVMDGYELAQHLRSVHPTGRLLLVAITGYGTDSDRLRSREAGFATHLTKPVDLETVAKVLEGRAELR